MLKHVTTCLLISIASMLGVDNAFGGVIYSFGGGHNAFRWDAAMQTIGGVERSLAGGLRYSMQGGSYQAFRDQFSWSTVPTVGEFQSAVEQAFSAWTSVDPQTGFAPSFAFVADLNTPVVGGGAFGSLNYLGAEIDLFAANAGNAGLRGFTAIQPAAQTVTLTSGVANYASSTAIAGVDISINNNSGAVYTLDSFRRLLTHEIGHSLGIDDADLGSLFLDDNYSASDPLATLNNNWASLVNPFDPANSAGLSFYTIGGSAFATSGVNLLMESNGLGIGAGNPIGNLIPLTADEYSTRQYLYPSLSSIPEPTSLILLAISFTALARRRRSR